MKRRIIVLLLPLFLFGCSKQGSEAVKHVDIQPSPPPPVLPFPVTVVENPEYTETDAFKAQVLALFRAMKYDDLEKLATKYRSSGECFSDGEWKLADFYDGIAFVVGRETDWKIQQQEIQVWINARPHSLTARIAMASFLKNYAWNARGGDFADKVTQENWRLFSERLHQAYNVLSDAKNLEHDDPVYWSIVLGIALGLEMPRPTYDALFKRAIFCQPLYEPFYKARANFLLPRWYGTNGEWEKDLAHSADSIGGDNGDMLYAQVVWDMHCSTYFPNIFEANPELSWARVDRGFAVILKRFPDSLSAKNEGAHLAALANDKDAARKYFTATQGNVDSRDWDAKGDFIEQATWAFGP